MVDEPIYRIVIMVSSIGATRIALTQVSQPIRPIRNQGATHAGNSKQSFCFGKSTTKLKEYSSGCLGILYRPDASVVPIEPLRYFGKIANQFVDHQIVLALSF
jgi:hypothetical protein